MASKRGSKDDAPKSVVEKFADAIDKVIHPEVEPENEKKKSVSSNDMSKHNKFDKFKK